MFRYVILIGQIGRIWAKSRKTRRIFQTVAVLGFFGLLTKKDKKYDNIYKDDTFIN